MISESTSIGANKLLPKFRTVSASAVQRLGRHTLNDRFWAAPQTTLAIRLRITVRSRLAFRVLSSCRLMTQSRYATILPEAAANTGEQGEKK